MRARRNLAPMTGLAGLQQTSFTRALLTLAALAIFAGYVAIATVATLFAPLAFFLFIAPIVLLAIAAAPAGRAAPKNIIMPLLLAGAVMMPLWPAYIHLKPGPLPILTPPRLLLYAVTAFWLYDMVFSPLRRGQFLVAIKKSRMIAGLVMLLFVLNFLSLPMAMGRALAGQEFFRQTIIWFIPFCAFATYVRNFPDFRRLLAASVIGAALAGIVAVAELGTGKLLASYLSPLISGDGEWLRIAQEQKIRDGVFRAQATHTHPLSLGEFLALAAPLAVGFGIAAKGRRRVFWGAALLAIVCGVLATNSRGAFFGLTAGLGLTGGVLLLRFLKTAAAHRFRPAVGLAALFLIIAAPVLVVGVNKFVTGDAGTSAARSSQSRIDQIQMAWPKILERPVIGYGTGRAVRIIGYWGRTLSVDNYYLSLAVDLGLPGPITFLCIMIFCMRSSMGQAKHSPPDMGWMLIGFAGAMAAFAVSRSIVSQTGNLSFFYLILGAYVGAAAGAGRRAAATLAAPGGYIRDA